MEETRHRLQRLGRRWRELTTLWDLDRPEDLQRLNEIGAADLVRDVNSQIRSNH